MKLSTFLLVLISFTSALSLSSAISNSSRISEHTLVKNSALNNTVSCNSDSSNVSDSSYLRLKPGKATGDLATDLTPGSYKGGSDTKSRGEYRFTSCEAVHLLSKMILAYLVFELGLLWEIRGF